MELLIVSWETNEPCYSHWIFCCIKNISFMLYDLLKLNKIQNKRKGTTVIKAHKCTI